MHSRCFQMVVIYGLGKQIIKIKKNIYKSNLSTFKSDTVQCWVHMRNGFKSKKVAKQGRL